MTLTQAISGGRDTLRKDIFDAVAAKEEKWGAQLFDIEIISLDPTAEVTHFMNQQREAESKRNASEHTAIAARKTKEENAIADKNVTLTMAQARLESAKMDAEAKIIAANAEAEAKIIATKAETESLELLTNSWRKNPEAEKYVHAKLGSETWANASSKGTTWVVSPEIVQNLLSPFVKDFVKK
jgi:regulator of protease activity HflC (stomatin/prohibitin superfamily)